MAEVACNFGKTSRSTPGTAPGISGHSSTMARRSVRNRIPSAKSIRSRRAGRFCPAPAMSQRSRLAMEAVDQRLVRRDRGLIQLLDPPFDHSALNPGYIKGYVPGVRENGGQYTHAAIWTVMAFAALGDSARAWELFAMINPTQPFELAGSDRKVQGGTLRGGRRCLRVSTAYRPRRLDLVHGLRRVDVPAGDASRCSDCAWKAPG